MKRLIKNYFRAFLLVSALLVVLIPTHFVHAIFSLTNIALGTALSYMSYVVFYTIGKMTVFFIGLFSKLVYIRLDASLPVIKQTWNIFRDFSNMLFIVALVWLAFAIIFQVKKYTISSMLWYLVIAAVLINFSLAIAGLVIDGTQVLTNVFLSAIGDPAVRIGQYLSPGQFFDPSLANSFSGLDILSSAGIALIFYIIIQMIFLFGVLVATAFALVRIFIVWGLLMVSPIFWMALILPGTRRWFSKWWSWFFGWTLFLPVYLFFLYLGLVFLSQQNSITAAVTANVANPNGTIGSSNLSLNVFIFYVFASFVLGYATVAAIRVTSAFGGSGFQLVANGSRNFINRYVPGFNTYQAGKAAGEKKLKELTSGTGSILPGPLSRQKQEAAFNRMFRVQGSRQRDFVDNVKKNYEELEKKYDTGQLSVEQLRANINPSKANTAEGYAYLKLAAKKGALNDTQFRSSLVNLKANPYAVNDLVKTAKESKFGGIRDLGKLAVDENLSSPALVAAKREMLDHLAEDPRKASKFSADDLKAAITVLGGEDSPETGKFMRNLAKIRPDLTIPFMVGQDDKQKLAEGKEPEGTEAERIQTSWDKAIRTEPKNLVDMPKDVWSKEEFRTALKKRYDQMNDKNKRNFRNRLEQMLMDKGEIRKEGEKLDILDKVIPPESGGRGGASTVAYRQSPDINEHNIIDLRTADWREDESE